ncbi:hypothetical protein RD792_004791 [Penstemon davidsonii]|uniref:BTB domain-containing protein n=1 Tax=Penstemon davidsonii TaxID=160366 RepID=A0ABR0DIU9_9LAMI|nr:hypothetical protein RD792_004790 [Penstemon davidsonii]KAK4489000.1 hypothetical protein RD792_004791 [Penstemon davidsonii]
MVQLKKKLSGEMKVKSIAGACEMPEPDLYVITSAGIRIPAHSKILASASPVLENIIERPKKRRSSERKIPMLGVPYDAVSAFIQFLYSSKCSEEHIEKYGIHLLALSHVYMVPQLKQRCTRGLGEGLMKENVVDILQLARMCDAPDLYLKCMKLLSNNFKAIEETEGWKFLQKHDPYLELEILQFIDESESRKRRTRRLREDQSLYVQLSEAMDCLEHICTEGCTSVGPCDMNLNEHKGPCSKFSTCQGLQLLINHFGTCKKRVNGGCVRCKRMWQLFRLHSSICDQPDECRVPLCR